MTTISTQQILETIRTQILNSTPISGSTVGGSLGNRFYFVQAPDVATFPYGVGRFMNRQTNVGDGNTDREETEVEIMLYARPRSQQYLLENVADAIDQALLRYSDTSNGLMFSRYRKRHTILGLTDPVDREVVTIRLVYGLTIWPMFLGQYSGSR